MSIFTSSYEKRLWFLAFLVLTAIILTLFIGQPLLNIFASQDVRAAIFLLVMALIGAMIIVHGLKYKPAKVEITIWFGLAAAFVMFFLRLGMAERSHLMEYSVLAIFIHKAITARVSNGKVIPRPALLSIFVVFIIGVMDECIQIFMPNRHFDPNDIVFNGMAAALAVGVSIFLAWARKRLVKSKV